MGSGRGIGCGASMARIFLIIFNIIFFLLGAASLGIGIWVLVDKSSFSKLLKLGSEKFNATQDAEKAAQNYLDSPSLLNAAAFTMIGIGGFNFIVGFCGCCGAVKLSKCLLYIYAVLIGLVLIVEITGAILGVVFSNRIEKELEKHLVASLRTYYMGIPDGYESDQGDNPSGAISMAWDYAHVLLKCCGVNGYKDFNSSTIWFKKHRKYVVGDKTYRGDQVKVPTTCCKMNDKFEELASKAEWTNIQNYMVSKSCPIDPVDEKLYNNVGCLPQMESYIKKYSTVIIGGAAAIAGVELFGILASCCLISAINRDKGY